jgi:hypothetical protein
MVGAAVGASVARNNSTPAPAPAVAPQAAPVSTDDTVAQLQQLAQLKDQGILTQAEFDAKKAQILGL